MYREHTSSVDISLESGERRLYNGQNVKTTEYGLTTVGIWAPQLNPLNPSEHRTIDNLYQPIWIHLGVLWLANERRRCFSKRFGLLQVDRRCWNISIRQRGWTSSFVFWTFGFGEIDDVLAVLANSTPLVHVRSNLKILLSCSVSIFKLYQASRLSVVDFNAIFQNSTSLFRIKLVMHGETFLTKEFFDRFWIFIEKRNFINSRDPWLR